MAVVGHNFVQAALVRRGEANLQALKDAWWQTQQGKCAKCLYIPTSKLGGAPQETLVADGGSASEIGLVCVSCYAEETTGMTTSLS